jgi:hypothetical protein
LSSLLMRSGDAGEISTAVFESADATYPLLRYRIVMEIKRIYTLILVCFAMLPRLLRQTYSFCLEELGSHIQANLSVVGGLPGMLPEVFDVLRHKHC